MVATGRVKRAEAKRQVWRLVLQSGCEALGRELQEWRGGVGCGVSRRQLGGAPGRDREIDSQG